MPPAGSAPEHDSVLIGACIMARHSGAVGGDTEKQIIGRAFKLHELATSRFGLTATPA